jgi:hypothetical protein
MLARNSIIILLFIAFAAFSPKTASAGQEPGWTTRVVKVGDDRRSSDATPILKRPYRPLHFYGNTVRRNHYRGNPLPTPRDLANTVRQVFRFRSV